MTNPKWYPLAIYFVLACIISWAFMVPAFIISEQNGYLLPTSATIGELMKAGLKDSRQIQIKKEKNQ